MTEGPLRPWQFLVYADESPPPYTQDLLALHMMGPSHTLLQIRPYYEDLDGEYRGGGVVEEEEEGREVEIENEGWYHRFYHLVTFSDSTHLFRTFLTFILHPRLVTTPHVHMTYVYSFSYVL